MYALSPVRGAALFHLEVASRYHAAAKSSMRMQTEKNAASADIKRLSMQN